MGLISHLWSPGELFHKHISYWVGFAYPLKEAKVSGNFDRSTFFLEAADSMCPGSLDVLVSWTWMARASFHPSAELSTVSSFRVPPQASTLF